MPSIEASDSRDDSHRRSASRRADADRSSSRVEAVPPAFRSTIAGLLGVEVLGLVANLPVIVLILLLAEAGGL